METQEYVALQIQYPKTYYIFQSSIAHKYSMPQHASGNAISDTTETTYINVENIIVSCLVQEKRPY